MVVPIVHLNGTSEEGLTAPMETAYAALSNAYDKMKQCAPNGRDYYPLAEGMLQLATGEHFARLKKIHALMNELEQLIGYIRERKCGIVASPWEE